MNRDPRLQLNKLVSWMHKIMEPSLLRITKRCNLAYIQLSRLAEISIRDKAKNMRASYMYSIQLGFEVTRKLVEMAEVLQHHRRRRSTIAQRVGRDRR